MHFTIIIGHSAERLYVRIEYPIDSPPVKSQQNVQMSGWRAEQEILQTFHPS